jgi:hypothetical protein
VRAFQHRGARDNRHMNAAEKAALRERARVAIRKALRAIHCAREVPPDL